jgi:hypothetical protein
LSLAANTACHLSEGEHICIQQYCNTKLNGYR